MISSGVARSRKELFGQEAAALSDVAAVRHQGKKKCKDKAAICGSKHIHNDKSKKGEGGKGRRVNRMTPAL